MAGRETPTDDAIVAMLHDVLRGLKELGVRQGRIDTDLAKIAKATRQREEPSEVVEGVPTLSRKTETQEAGGTLLRRPTASSSIGRG